MNDIFSKLYSFDVGSHVVWGNFGFGEVPYLEWATAWKLLKQQFPQAESMIHTNDKGLPYFTDDLGVFVHVSIKIDEHIVSDWYPVEKEKQNAAGITDAHQRALVKVCGRLGLGLRLWEKSGREMLELITPEQRKFFADKAREIGWQTSEVKELLERFGYAKSDEIRKGDLDKLILELEK